MKVSTLGIDLAKNTFQLHAAGRRGEKISNKKVKREKLLSVIEKLDQEDDATSTAEILKMVCTATYR